MGGACCDSRCFNSRSPSGLRPTAESFLDVIEGFNSRSPSGLRLSPRFAQPTNAMFQFTQPKRAATWNAKRICAPSTGFNSRSPSGLRRLLQRYNKKEILSKDKSRKSLSVIILDEEDKAVKLELTDNQPLRNSNKIMFTWDSQPNIFV